MKHYNNDPRIKPAKNIKPRSSLQKATSAANWLIYFRLQFIRRRHFTCLYMSAKTCRSLHSYNQAVRELKRSIKEDLATTKIGMLANRKIKLDR